MRSIRVGSRGSRLALAQVAEVVRQLAEWETTVQAFVTAGDLDKETPIDRVEGTDFFTDAIERALLNNEIDLAVHSAKDLPEKIPEGLKIGAVTRSIDPADVLVSAGNLKLAELLPDARVGTSSRRRQEQVLKARPDLKVLPLRGDIEARLAKLDAGEFDAIIVAAAGLIRLRLEKRIAERLRFETAKYQGALALEIRQDDQELEKWLKEKFI